MATSPATSPFGNWLFTANATANVCPTWSAAGFTFKCAPPNACTTDSASGRQFCCEFGTDICWNHAATCADDGTTSVCTRGTSTWCCMRNSEICTGSSGQINICWSASKNPLLQIDTKVLNDTASKLIAAQPSASLYTFDPNALIALTASTSSSSTSTSKPTPGSTSGSSIGTAAPKDTSTNTSANLPGKTDGVNDGSNNTNPATSPSSTGLPSGTIAGIVVGILAALAIGIAVGFWLNRRKKKDPSSAPPTSTDGTMVGSPGAFDPSEIKYVYGGPPPGELPTQEHYREELPAEREYGYHAPVELQAGEVGGGYQQQQQQQQGGEYQQGVRGYEQSVSPQSGGGGYSDSVASPQGGFYAPQQGGQR